MDFAAGRESYSTMQFLLARKLRVSRSPSAALSIDQLRAQFLPLVFAYALRRLASHADAEDAVVETFVALAQQRERCPHDPDAARGWVLGIARRKVIDQLRKQGRQRTTSLSVLVEHALPSTSEAPLLTQEALEKLWEVLASLRPEQREVLQLKYMEELSLKEIGQVLGKSEAAVSSLLQRARASALRAGRDYFLEDAS